MVLERVKLKDLWVRLFELNTAILLLLVFVLGSQYLTVVAVILNLGVAVMSFTSMFLPNWSFKEVAEALFG